MLKMPHVGLMCKANYGSCGLTGWPQQLPRSVCGRAGAQVYALARFRQEGAKDPTPQEIDTAQRRLTDYLERDRPMSEQKAILKSPNIRLACPGASILIEQRQKRPGLGPNTTR